MLNCTVTASDIIDHLNNSRVLFIPVVEGEVYLWKLENIYFVGFMDDRTLFWSDDVNLVYQFIDTLLVRGAEFQIVTDCTNMEFDSYFRIPLN